MYALSDVANKGRHHRWQSKWQLYALHYKMIVKPIKTTKHVAVSHPSTKTNEHRFIRATTTLCTPPPPPLESVLEVRRKIERFIVLRSLSYCVPCWHGTTYDMRVTTVESTVRLRIPNSFPYGIKARSVLVRCRIRRAEVSTALVRRSAGKTMGAVGTERQNLAKKV